MFVYVIVNSETLKIYVGQHKGDSLLRYLQRKLSAAAHREASGSYLFASMRKYPKAVWSIHPLISNLQTRKECDYWERIFIKALNTQHREVGYNICRGGEGNTSPGYWLGKKRSPETKAKIRLAKAGVTVANSTSFQPGNVPWNAGKPAPQCNRRKGQKMQYKSAESKQRALSGLRPHAVGEYQYTTADCKKMSIAHQTCTCPSHVAARERKRLAIF